MKKIIGIAAASLTLMGCASQAMAADDSMQIKVQDYCGKVSARLMKAAADYNHQLSNNVKPEEAKNSVTQQMISSEEYVSASPAVKAQIDSVVNSSTDYSQHSIMMANMIKIHQPISEVHGWTWAYNNVIPFTAWCNYNHING